MSKTIFILSCCLAWTSYSLGQVEQLTATLEALENLLIKVEAGKVTYEHALKYDPKKPYNISLSVFEKGKKDVQTQYDLNLTDLNKRLIDWDSKRDVIPFVIQTTNKQKFITVTKNGLQEDYENELIFYAFSSDNARAIDSTLKKCIELAEPILKEEINITEIEEGFKWMVSNIEDVKINEDLFQQQFEVIDKAKTIIKFTLEEDEGTTSHLLTLADLRPSAVKLEIKGKKVSVSAKTDQSLKYIQVGKDDERANFTNEINILVNSIEEGRWLKNVLTKTIQLAKDQYKSQKLKVNSITQGFDLLNGLIIESLGKGGTVQQSLKGSCQAVLEVEGKESNMYKFHFGDLLEKSIKIKVNGKYLSLLIASGKKVPLIQLFEEDQLDKYVDDFSLYVSDIESAKTLEKGIEIMVGLCRENRPYLFSETANKENLLEWIINNTKPVQLESKDFEQKLEQMELGNYCELAFTQTENTPRKTTKNIYEISLIDIDRKQLSYHIKGNELAISVNAKGKNKYIKYYQDEKVEDYVNTFNIYFEDLEVARNMLRAWDLLLTGCAE